MFSPLLIKASFDSGFEIDSVIAALVVKTQNLGTIQPVCVNLSSNRTNVPPGLGFEFDFDVFQNSWSRKVSNFVAHGLALGATKAESQFSFSGLPASDTESTSYQLTTGVLHELTEKFLLVIC